MSISACRLIGCGLLLLSGGAVGETASAENETTDLEPIVVTATRRPMEALFHAGNVSRVNDATVERTSAVHINQLLFRVPGTWISRGSGQEHLTAIRSPVLTGAGACGAFLFLEDGIPIRPAGFCNVNQFFEVNSEQADAVEVIRGPGSALYGSNALHGLINVISTDPRDAGSARASVEAGSDDYYRTRLDTGGGDTRLRFNAVDDGSFREDAGFEQYKLNLDHQASESLRLSLAATDLDQDTAGFIFGEDAFRDPGLRTANLNPEAFRRAESQRVAAHWTPDDALAIRAYGRRSRMTFLRHFVPEQSLEKNGQDSAGVLISRDWLASEPGNLITGLDLEYTRGFLEETQDEPLTEGPEFLQETRPAGAHYDYDVDAALVSPYLHAEHALTPEWRITAGLRAEYLRYDYENHLPDGNTRDDGTECGLGGCIFNRPGDRSDDFVNLAPKIALLYSPVGQLGAWLRLARDFRAPRTPELYRLQRGRETADLGSEVVNSL
jgi:outer membrane receptor protein involved in Fe transport